VILNEPRGTHSRSDDHYPQPSDTFEQEESYTDVFSPHALEEPDECVSTFDVSVANNSELSPSTSASSSSDLYIEEQIELLQAQIDVLREVSDQRKMQKKGRLDEFEIPRATSLPKDTGCISPFLELYNDEKS
jgi:hypothetical protein